MTTINIKEINNIIKSKYNKFNKLAYNKKEELYYKNIQKINSNDIKFNFLLNIININDLIIKAHLKKKKVKLLCVRPDNKTDKYFIKLLKYKKIKMISSGAYGRVYLGEKNKKKFAIKIENYEPNKNWHWKLKGSVNLIEHIDAIIEEYKIGVKLGKHLIGPKVYNLTFIYDEINDDIYSIIEMEYLKSETLIGYESKKKLTKKENKQLNDKIDKLHKLKYIHGDLHKNNILVVKKNKKLHFYLIDYGFAQLQKDVIKDLKNKNKNTIKEHKISNILKNIIVQDIIINKDINIII